MATPSATGRLARHFFQPRNPLQSFFLPRPLPRSHAFFESTVPGFRWSHTRSFPRNQGRQDATYRIYTVLLATGLTGLAFASACSNPLRMDTIAADMSTEPTLPETSSSLPTYPVEKYHDTRDPSLPRFHLDEIRKHDGTSEHPWVMRGDKVYDITDWVAAHPGGDVILRAAGGSIEPYWDIFAIHKSDYVLEILSQYQIGLVHASDLVDGKPVQHTIEDPFADDPHRDPALMTLTDKPRNAETPGEALDASFLTPNGLFYVRNHMWVPTVTDGDDFVLTIELPDGDTKTYTVRELKEKFTPRSVAAVLQCSGNRRKNMSDGSGRKANGLPWTVGAISNATWQGVYLSDILADAGFHVPSAMDGSSDVKHVHFAGSEAYSASIPIKKAVDPAGDVLVAYGMNGEPLPRDHGFPLRTIVPGHVAARSVKWLNRIALSDEESSSQWQRRDYKCFGPNETKVDWDAAPAIQELPVQSAITTIRLGDVAQPGQPRSVSLGGYAFSGGGRDIIRVDVSLDDGKTWAQARLLPDCIAVDGKPSPCTGHAAWTWKRWRYEAAIPDAAFAAAAAAADATATGDRAKRCTRIVVKATDEVYNTQPESHAATWNVRGNLATAWHRVTVCADCATGAVKVDSR